MRFLNSLKNDIRFQIKYGFYFLYAFFSLVYIIALRITPPDYRKLAASLIILTDPAMLGVFFIGGIWLLEKGEGLHSFWSITPLRSVEYILSKSISLAIISTISADLIVLTAMYGRFRFMLFSFCIFIGAVAFNFIGLTVASYARSVNHYIIIVIIPSVVLVIPPVLTAFGMTHPLLELFPGTALWHIIENSMNQTGRMNAPMIINLILWLGLLLFLSDKRIAAAMRTEGGEGL